MMSILPIQFFISKGSKCMIMIDQFLYENLISQFFIDDKLLTSKAERVENCLKFVSRKVSYANNNAAETVKKRIISLELTFMKKWRHAECKPSQFKAKNEKWLHICMQLPPSATFVTSAPKIPGRPKININNSSRTSKYLKAVELSDCDISVLLLALVKATKRENDRNLEYVVKCLHKSRRNSDGEIVDKIRGFIESGLCPVKPTKINPLRALTHLLDNGLSKPQYINTKSLAKEVGSDIFPSYKDVVQVKSQCRPPPENLTITDISSSLPLQALLNHTASRLLLLQEEVIKAYALDSKTNNNELQIKFQLKWGFDGSSSQSQYNQKFTNIGYAQERRVGDDTSLFATTVVPLRMSIRSDANIIIWNNRTPQSPRWCRPLRLQFEKETRELTLRVKQSVENEIAVLHTFDATISGFKVSVYFELYLTMIDGKVLAAITNTESSQRCPLCKAKPSQFNDLSNISTRFKADERIRSFEWLLHLSYRLEVKKWQMRGEVLQTVLKKSKIRIQERFIRLMNLRVDFPCSGGSGNSNSGPVARTAFSNPMVLSEILDLNVDLINRIATILIALSCQLPLDVDKFSQFCHETARLYVIEYYWFPMPPSIHKALIHTREILLANDLPLGILAEDASESCNKFYRHNRQFHAREASREKNMFDVFNRALDSSDPLIASYNQQKRLNSRNQKCIPLDVQNLLKSPEAPVSSIEDEIEETLDDVLNEVTEVLDDISLPEDPYYEEFC